MTEMIGRALLVLTTLSVLGGCATVRTLDELHALAPMLAEPAGPIFLDCKIIGSIPAPFLLENLAQERRKP